MRFPFSHTTALSGLLILLIRAFLPIHASNAPPGQVPYTLYQLELQDQLAKNTVAIQGKAYERFFNPNLYVSPEMIRPSYTPIDCPSDAMEANLSDLNTLLVPAETVLPHENAWCAYPSGAGYVASRTHFPGSTGEMAQWWMWWHSAEGARYTLWHPWAHINVSSSASSTFINASLSDKDKLYGSFHQISEIIGDTREDIKIHWFPPSHFGLDKSKMQEAGVVADACGEIYKGPLKVIDMIHLWFRKKDGSGVELRSRYFLASRVSLAGVIPLDPITTPLGLPNLFVGKKLAHLQFHHDQQEFTHLAGFLPDIYKVFGNGNGTRRTR